MNKHTLKKYLALLLFAGACSPVFAYKYVGIIVESNGEGQNNTTMQHTRAASCAPATALRDLEWNNVEALIETGGSMWQDRSTGSAAYEIPKVENGTGPSSLYAGALWMGGKSPDQQLKLAAIKFRTEGNDYWTGPLTNDGAAEVTEDVCEAYDRFFVSLRQDAQRHYQYQQAIANNTVAEEFPDGYSMPPYFQEYPAIGNTALGQDYFLSPFYDYNSNLVYDPENGDYPWYDFLREINCAERRREDPVPLFGDQTFYWIFNDKGNVHSESLGQPIGMEVRAQAFAFNTTDEVNNMTFYNYVLINQGTQTLTQTYFGTWVDADLGTSTDDFVGCDVQRGLGYCYNGDAVDESSGTSPGYGENPPAVGIDFFEGPYQDSDDIDNPLTTDFQDANDSLGIPYRGIGIGYGDGVEDNERFGMRRFVYYNNSTNPINGEPETPLHYYNYMNGIWKNGQKMLYGGDGVEGHTGVTEIEADYMFPDDTDPYNWGTHGTSVDPWNEVESGNAPADRRFIQAAGPFTLEPGDYNNITIGAVWARSNSGDPFESVRLMRIADDKAQSLFDNCFELVSGPDAPDIDVVELENELILILNNENGISNNYHEDYTEFDPSIPEQLIDGTLLDTIARSYAFQGYLVYQLVSEQVGANELDDITKARLIAQCDIRDEVENIVNYVKDQENDLVTPILKVQGANEGLQHSFRILTDEFAQGDNALVNHKTYYFMVIAYGYNSYQDYNLADQTGQANSFISSRKAAVGEIQVITAIPHKVSPAQGGTILNSSYGDGVALIRHEGKGNGLNVLDISPQSEQDILENTYVDDLEFMPGRGPVNIKVVDPLLVPSADFELRLDSAGVGINNQNAHWKLYNMTDGTTFTPYHSFQVETEDIVLGTGLAITWGQYEYLNDEAGVEATHFTDHLESTIEFANPSMPWLLGIPDIDGFVEQNWIRSGTVESTNGVPEEVIYNDYTQPGPSDETWMDRNEAFEKVLGGTWSPYCLVSFTDERNNSDGELVTMVNVAPTVETVSGDLSNAISPEYFSNIKGLNNVDIVLTSDKDKWTRCAVLEMQGIPELTENGESEKMKLRQRASVDKNGNPDNTGTTGMGWFPGYAIDVGTGERLNMAFGEDSWLVGENGRDMIWNPTSRLYTDIGAQPLFAGQHWIYVFKNNRAEEEGEVEYMPAYDQGEFLRQNMADPVTATWKDVMRGCTWVGSSWLNPGFELLPVEDGLIPSDVRIRLRVGKEYKPFDPSGGNVEDLTNAQNHWNPYYSFSTKNLAALTGDVTTLSSSLDFINVVPNPYYAYSEYESSKLDNRVKITNLPEECTVTIYNISGTLIRQYQKADPMTSLDWDLKNHKNIPIASGVYIIHIEVPGIGEKILKWFGVMRPVDLDNF